MGSDGIPASLFLPQGATNVEKGGSDDVFGMTYDLVVDGTRWSAVEAVSRGLSEDWSPRWNGNFYDPTTDVPTSHVTGWDDWWPRESEAPSKAPAAWQGTWENGKGEVLWIQLVQQERDASPTRERVDDAGTTGVHVEVILTGTDEIETLSRVNRIYRIVHAFEKGSETGCSWSARSDRLVFRSAAETGPDASVLQLEDLCTDSWGPFAGQYPLAPEETTVLVRLTPRGSRRMAAWTREHRGGALDVYFDGEKVSSVRYDFPVGEFALIRGIPEDLAREIIAALGTPPVFDVETGERVR